MSDLIALYNGKLLTVHDQTVCAGEVCSIHNPTEHVMRTFPQLWRSDWGGFMERICPHGIGHPDPDDHRVRTQRGLGLHGCDGCCTGVAL